ncbi:hypothetical protein ACNGEM_07340 [Campylobacter coli]
MYLNKETNESTYTAKEIKSDYFTNKLHKNIKGTAGYVIFFGIFTAVCLIFQCLDYIIDYYIPGSGIFNKNFQVPMETLTTLYATLCCVYVGVDRTTSVIATFKGTKDSANYGNPERNRHIIIQNFFICSLALILNRFFDANLGLEPLLVSFGGSIILYVSGQKIVYQASKFAPEKDINKNGIDDRIENNKDLINVLNEAVKNDRHFKVYYVDPRGVESLEFDSNPNDNTPSIPNEPAVPIPIASMVEPINPESNLIESKS